MTEISFIISLKLHDKSSKLSYKFYVQTSALCLTVIYLGVTTAGFATDTLTWYSLPADTIYVEWGAGRSHCLNVVQGSQ